MAVLGRLALAGDEALMDAGCGTGRVTAELARLLARGHVVAVDLSENMLQQAAAVNLAAFGDRVTLVRADLADLPFQAEFDGIVSTAAFHWVKDHDALFRSLFRSLKRGAWVEAQCGGGPNLAAVLSRADKIMHLPPFHSFFENYSAWEPWEFATPQDTIRRMRAVGFEAVEAWLQPAPVRFHVAQQCREFSATAIFRCHLERLSDPQLREEFLDRVMEGCDLQLDYWRLNLRGTKI